MSSKKPWFILVALGFVLIAVGLLWNGVSAWSTSATRRGLNQLEEKRTIALSDLEKADQTFQQNRQLYAARWTVGFAEELSMAGANLDDNGQVANLVAESFAVLNDDRQQAESLRETAQALFEESVDIVNKINGPPAYFAILKEKSEQAEGQVSNATITIVQARNHIDSLRADPWNQSYGVGMSRSLRHLQEAESQLELAKNTLATPLANDNVQYDLVMVYDQATEAITIANVAKIWATQDNDSARLAVNTISSAESTLSDAEFYIARSNYQTIDARARLNSTAAVSLNEANQAFWGTGSYTEPNYNRAIELAEQSKREANAAKLIASTPTPTPEPTSTPRPIPTSPPIIFDDDDDSTIFDSDPWSSSGSDSDSGSIFDDDDYGLGSGSIFDDDSPDLDFGTDDPSWSESFDTGNDDSAWDSDWP